MRLLAAAAFVHVVCIGTYIGWPPFAPTWLAWVVLIVGLGAVPVGIYALATLNRRRPAPRPPRSGG